MPARIAVVSASVGSGHDGAAVELSRRLRAQGFVVSQHDSVNLMPQRSGQLLRGIYRRQLELAPRTWGWFLAAGQHTRFARMLASATAAIDDTMLAAIGTDAAAVVSTYPLASQVLGRLRRQGRLAAPVVTYLTDMSVHPLWVADGVDAHLAIHAEPARQARQLGAADVHVVTPAVDQACTDPDGAETSSDEARCRWGLPQDGPLALIVAGAWGVGAVERTSRDVAATGLAVPVVACGHNEALRARLRRSSTAVALGWVHDMPSLLRACQVVVQNAGGLSSLEALAAGVPVVTYRCLPGHGRSNADALDRAGWVPWIRTRQDLAPGLRRAMSGGWSVPPPSGPPPEAVIGAVATPVWRLPSARPA